MRHELQAAKGLPLFGNVQIAPKTNDENWEKGFLLRLELILACVPVGARFRQCIRLASVRVPRLDRRVRTGRHQRLAPWHTKAREVSLEQLWMIARGHSKACNACPPAGVGCVEAVSGGLAEVGIVIRFQVSWSRPFMGAAANDPPLLSAPKLGETSRLFYSRRLGVRVAAKARASTRVSLPSSCRFFLKHLKRARLALDASQSRVSFL